MISLEEKARLLNQLEAELRREYEALRAAQLATVQGATHEEAKPENDKDTRALEQSYLARGQAARVVELEADLAKLAQLKPRAFGPDDAVGLGAIVELDEPGTSPQLYLLAPAGAGEVLDSDRGPIKIVTPSSPLGRALAGAHLDEDIELHSPRGKRLLSLTALC